MSTDTMKLPFIFFTASALLLARVGATGVVQLTSSNFHSYIGASKPALAEL